MEQAGFFSRAATAMGVPIAVRELAVAGRRARTYVLRASVALGLGSIVMLVIFFSRLDSTGADANLGLRLFWWFSWMAMALVVLMGPITAGGSIAEERRENTLGLLFLTDLRPGGIAFGKFFSAATFMLQLLLVGTPILFSGVILGGVELEQALHVFAIIVATALAAIAIGLCTGTLAEGTVGSIFLALFTTGLVLVLPILGAMILGGVVARLTGSPVPGQVADLIYEYNPFIALDAELALGGSDLWWRASAMCLGVTLVSLVLASFRLGSLRRSFSPRKDTIGSVAKRLKSKRPPYTEVKNPVYELELRHASGTLERILRVAIYVGGPLAAAATPALVAWVDDSFAFIMFVVYLLLGLFLGLVVGVVAAMSLGQEREDGTLELLLTTSMRPYNIINGKVVAIGRRLGIPFLVLQLLFVIGAGLAVAVMVGKSTTGANQSYEMLFLVGFTVAGALFTAALQVIHAASLAFIAMAIGVRAQARTALATVVGIFVASMCLCTFSCGYASLCVASAEVIAAAVCYHDLTRQLRKYALRR